MKQVVAGQVLLILCCAVYLVWWYRGYRPGVTVSRVGGVNGMLLAVTALLGAAGIAVSMLPLPVIRKTLIGQNTILMAGIVLYFILLLITRGFFRRVVTTELILIVGWTTLEMVLVDRLYAAEAITQGGFLTIGIVIAMAFLISMILYVAYYRMEEMKAFYAAMVPLVTEAAAMAVLIGIVLGR